MGSVYAENRWGENKYKGTAIRFIGRALKFQLIEISYRKKCESCKFVSMRTENPV